MQVLTFEMMSSTVAEGYLEETVQNKIQIAGKLEGCNVSASYSTISSNEPMNLTFTSTSNKSEAFSFKFQYERE